MMIDGPAPGPVGLCSTKVAVGHSTFRPQKHTLKLCMAVWLVAQVNHLDVVQWLEVHK